MNGLIGHGKDRKSELKFLKGARYGAVKPFFGETGFQ